MIRRRELGAAKRGGDEGVMREEIDLARQTGRRLEERFGGGRLKERQLGAGEAEPMGEVAAPQKVFPRATPTVNPHYSG